MGTLPENSHQTTTRNASTHLQTQNSDANMATGLLSGRRGSFVTVLAPRLWLEVGLRQHLCGRVYALFTMPKRDRTYQRDIGDFWRGRQNGDLTRLQQHFPELQKLYFTLRRLLPVINQSVAYDTAKRWCGEERRPRVSVEGGGPWSGCLGLSPPETYPGKRRAKLPTELVVLKRLQLSLVPNDCSSR
jgi:hypothetical protein